MATREAVRESGREDAWEGGCERPRTMGAEVLANAAAKAELGAPAGMRTATALTPEGGGVPLQGWAAAVGLLLSLAGWWPNGAGGDPP